MKHTNTNSFNNALKAYLLPIIESKAEGCEETTTGNPYKWVLDTARKEVGHEFDRHGDQGGLEYWLSGLGMGIDYTYAGIIEAAEKMHACKLTEKEADMMCDRWFGFLAAKILQFSRK